ncbi:MAG: ferritin family protein [Desulfobacterium sp.]|jgi:rubrerythrin|nr:ferritin family protein [Desulfobacterium sp.]
MSFSYIDEIFAFAIEKEEEAVAFYMDLSKKEKFASLKETFISFAEEEKKHAKMLTDLSKDSSKVDTYEVKAVPDLKISDYLVDIEYEEGMLMPDILRIAMKREEQAVHLYRDLGDKSNDPELKKIFEILVQEESKHKLALESMYDDFLADNEN